MDGVSEPVIHTGASTIYNGSKHRHYTHGPRRHRSGPGGIHGGDTGRTERSRGRSRRKGDGSGVCLNHGCIPAKALIHAACFQRDIASWNDIGINTGEVDVDFQAVQEWKADAIRRLDEGVLRTLDHHGVEYVEGAARFLDSATVGVDGPGATEEVAFEHAVIAPDPNRSRSRDWSSNRTA
jgi:dihydrolipoamide dehydrogenase